MCMWRNCSYFVLYSTNLFFFTSYFQVRGFFCINIISDALLLSGYNYAQVFCTQLWYVHDDDVVIG